MKAQRGVGVYLYSLFHLGGRWGWVANNTRPGRLIARERTSVFVLQEAGCFGRPVWTGAKYLSPTTIGFQDHPTLSELLYRLTYPGPLQLYVSFHLFFFGFPFSLSFCISLSNLSLFLTLFLSLCFLSLPFPFLPRWKRIEISCWSLIPFELKFQVPLFKCFFSCRFCWYFRIYYDLLVLTAICGQLKAAYTLSAI